MKEHTKAYAAGLMDAEGCFTIVRQQDNFGVHHHPVLAVNNTCKPLIKWLVKHFGGTVYHYSPGGNRRDFWRWQAGSNKHSSVFISLIFPYLRLKHKEASLLKEFCDSFETLDSKKRDSLCSKIRKLKRESVTTDTQGFPRNITNAYFAGFFDGEGYVGLSRSSDGYVKSLKIAIGGTFNDLLKEMVLHYGGLWYPKKQVSNNKPVSYWELRASELQQKFLLSILPFLVGKKEQAKLALEYRRKGRIQDRKMRESYYWKFIELKGKKIQSGLTSDSKSAPVETQTA